jgi:hypothetical protein
MAQNFEQWTASMAEMAAMQTLAGATIGIEASNAPSRKLSFPL